MTDIEAMAMHWVDSDQELARLCQHWQSLGLLALDTEFMRTSTFYPKLGLLQIGDGDACYLIDPLAISAWQPLLDLFDSSDMTFIVHSAGEDLVLLYTSFGVLPRNLFDTQLAAAFLGYGFSLSYQALVSTELSIEVEKDETRSDWLQRPLSDAQLRYAAIDVRYLHGLYASLSEQLQATPKYDWFVGECQQLLDIAVQSESSNLWAQSYRNVSNAWRLDQAGLERLQRLCFWRETQARRRDKPRSWIAKDAELFAIAEHMKGDDFSTERLQQVRGVPTGLLKRQGKRLLDFMLDPPAEVQQAPATEVTPPLTPDQRNILKRCQSAARAQAEQLDMAPELLARKKQILGLLESFSQNQELAWSGDMAGWRKQVLQADFEQAVRGNQT